MRRTLAIIIAPALALSALPAAAQEARLGWAMLPALADVDRDGDGLLSQAEIGGTMIPVEADADGDGLFDLPELTAYLFARADADDSGYLEPAELQAMRGLAAAGVYEYGG